MTIICTFKGFCNVHNKSDQTVIIEFRLRFGTYFLLRGIDVGNNTEWQVNLDYWYGMFNILLVIITCHTEN